MAIELIEQYVDRGQFASDTEFIKAQLKEAFDSYNALSKQRVSLSLGDSGKKVTDELSKANQLLLKTSQLNDKAAATTLKLARAKQAEATARKNNAQASQVEQKTQEATTRATEREDKARTRANNANREALRAYKSLVREYNILRKVAEDYGASLGVNSTQYIEAAKRADELNTKLKAIDKGIGNSQRSVGNYASGFNGLSNSFNQITRELPAFTNSVQTGFLAISNNLPILFDEIGRARQQIVELRKAGQPAPSLFKSIAGSFFTLGTALSLGVTALTIFGPQIAKFVQSLFQGREALDRFTESQRILGETLKSGGLVEAAASVAELRINIDLAKQGFLDKDKVVKQYNETIGKTTGEVKSLEEAEKSLQKNADAYIKMTLLKAAAQLALEDASKKALQAELDRRKREEEFLTTGDQLTAFGAGNVSAPGLVPGLARQAERQEAEFRRQQSKIRKDAAIKQSEDDAKTLTDIATDFQKQAAEISKQFNFDFFGGTGDKGKANDRLKTIRAALFTAELEDFRDQLKALADSEQLSIRARQNFRNRAAAIERQLLNEQAAFEIQLEKDKLQDVLGDKDSSANSKINAQNEYSVRVQEIERALAFNLIKLNRDTEAALLKIKGDGNKAILEEEKKLVEQLTEQNRIQAEKRLNEETQRLERTTALISIDSNILLTAENKKLAALERARAKGKISDAKYVAEKKAIEQRIAEIQLESQINQLKAEITYAEQVIKIRKALGQETIKEEEKIAAIRAQISQLQAQGAGKNAEVDRINQLRDAYRQLANELKNLFGSVVNGIFERQKNQIQDQIDLIEQRKQREIEAVNAEAISNQEKADKIKLIEARAEANRQQLEIKKRQTQQRQAQFERALTLVSIGQNIAQGVTAALTSKPPNVILAAVIGAIGAAQIASVLATPIPRYKDGTTFHPGGVMIVGDGGVPEVVKEPGKDPYITPATDTLLSAPRGTKVFKSLDSVNEGMLYAAMKNMQLQAPVMDQSSYADAIVSALERESRRSTRETVQALKNLPRPAGNNRIRTGSAFTNYINRNVYE